MTDRIDGFNDGATHAAQQSAEETEGDIFSLEPRPGGFLTEYEWGFLSGLKAWRACNATHEDREIEG